MTDDAGASANNAETAPPAFLTDLASQRKIPIPTPKCQIGRGDVNDVILDADSSISRVHFYIRYEDGKYQIEDANSSHGTFVNGKKVTDPEPIIDGDVLKIGESILWFNIETG